MDFDLVKEIELMDEYNRKVTEQSIKIKEYLNGKYDIDLETYEVEHCCQLVEGTVGDRKSEYGRDILYVKGIGESRWTNNGFFRRYVPMGEDSGHEIYFFPLGDNKYIMVAR